VATPPSRKKIPQAGEHNAKNSINGLHRDKENSNPWGSSAIPPSASLYRERITLVPIDHSGFLHRRAHDRPLMADCVEKLGVEADRDR